MRAATADLRRVGTELTAEWVDRLGEEQLPGAGEDATFDLVTVDLEPLPPLTDRSLLRKLSDALGHQLLDPWGSPYEVRWAQPPAGSSSDQGDAPQFEASTIGFAVRSCGPDRTCGSPAQYAVGPMAPSQTPAELGSAGEPVDPGRDDLVWANGFFVRWPIQQ